jgi:hypothetical protein
MTSAASQAIRALIPPPLDTPVTPTRAGSAHVRRSTAPITVRRYATSSGLPTDVPEMFQNGRPPVAVG